MELSSGSHNDPIDPFILSVFIGEIKLQCQFGLTAFNSAIASIRCGPPHETFFFAHSFLTHAAMVSRCLSARKGVVTNPEKHRLGAEKTARLKKLRTTRGDQIWQELDLEGESIIYDHTLRDHLEHFDERLEVWAISSLNRNFADMNIASVGAIVGLDPGDYQRNLDPDTLHFSFQGENFDLHAIAMELKRIGEAAAKWLGQYENRSLNGI